MNPATELSINRDAIEQHRHVIAQLERRRAVLLADARTKGWSLGMLADATGLTRQRVFQLTNERGER